jgi:thioredoxin-like negative regulator of GroEL
MSAILFLNKNDFVIKNGDKGKILCFRSEHKGLTLVLFYSVDCQYCDEFMKHFKQMPNIMSGCGFAIININKNMEIVQMSKNTIAPITYVPDVILYVDGYPFIRYDGPANVESIQKFLVDIYQKLQQKTQFATHQPQPPQQQQYHSPQQQQYQPQKQPTVNQIPAYTTGVPVTGDKRDKRCYLNFNTAYTK